MPTVENVAVEQHDDNGIKFKAMEAESCLVDPQLPQLSLCRSQITDTSGGVT